MNLLQRYSMVSALAMIASCGDRSATVEKNVSAMPVASRPEILRKETVSAVFTGWDTGDYVWARLRVPGREPIGVWSGPSPIDFFLDSHVGEPLTIELETIRTNVPEAGGQTEVQRISSARLGNLTAELWWQSLSAKERQDAQIRLAGALEPRPPVEQQ
jgi:hypothetical protein